jgi:hypothetical protein
MQTESYHTTRQSFQPQSFYFRSPLIKACLRCGSRFFFGGQTFPVFCVEGRVEIIHVCRRCTKLGVPAQPPVSNYFERKVAA